MNKLLIPTGTLIILLTFAACNSRSEIMEPTVRAEKEMAELKAKVSELEKEVGGTGKAKKTAVVASPEIPKAEKAATVKSILEKDSKSEKDSKKISDSSNFIKLDSSPSNNAIIKTKLVEFTGTVSPSTVKIVVTASMKGAGEKSVQDVYQLKNFKKGDKTFSYKAGTDWGNLAKGDNTYEFEAFFENETSKKTSITITYKSDENFINLLSPADGNSFEKGKIVEFKGKVSPNVTKIVVTGGGKDFKENYQLQNFKIGDTEFVYKASEKWGNIATGSNDYEFKAYFKDGGTEAVKVKILYK